MSGGSGYPDSSTFNLLVTGGDGSGGVVQATTNANGVIISFAATPLAGGSLYTTGIAATGPSAVVATTGSGAELAFERRNGLTQLIDARDIGDGRCNKMPAGLQFGRQRCEGRGITIDRANRASVGGK